MTQGEFTHVRDLLEREVAELKDELRAAVSDAALDTPLGSQSSIYALLRSRKQAPSVALARLVSGFDPPGVSPCLQGPPTPRQEAWPRLARRRAGSGAALRLHPARASTPALLSLLGTRARENVRDSAWDGSECRPRKRTRDSQRLLEAGLSGAAAPVSRPLRARHPNGPGTRSAEFPAHP